MSDTHTIRDDRWRYFALANPPHNNQNFIVAAIGKWHQDLIFYEEDYSIMIKYSPHVKHKQNSKTKK
jgi:hypothetical protein